MNTSPPPPASPPAPPQLIRGTTRIVGVFGYPVRHSASPPMHNAAFAHLGLDFAYAPFAVAPEAIGAALAGVRALGMAGVNITVPLKELVLPHLDDASDTARALGSVNTVVNRDGELWGHSTDGDGFLKALAVAGVSTVAGLRVVVLGAGGSARAVVYALARAGAQVVVANRTDARARDLAARFAPACEIEVAPFTETGLRVALQGASVLVNTTSLGLHGTDSSGSPLPVPLDALKPPLLVTDLIYNPPQTPFLALAHAQGCPTQNGVEMLVQQGALAFSLWTGIADPPVDVMRQAVQ